MSQRSRESHARVFFDLPEGVTAPAAVLDASQYVEEWDIETASEPWRHGIATLPTIEFQGDPVELAKRVRRRVNAILESSQLPVVLGGEHSITIGVVEAIADHFNDLSVLQLDAHADTRNSYHGSTHNHGCVMARVAEKCPIVQVGIRSLDGAEIRELDRSRVFWAHQIATATNNSWMNRVLDLLTPNVYVTVDMDSFDPSIIPATEPPNQVDWIGIKSPACWAKWPANAVWWVLTWSSCSQVIRLRPLPGPS